LEVFADAVVVLLDDDLTHEWVLHHDAGEFADIGSCRLVILVGESMRVGVVSRLEAESSCVTVHLLQEIFHRLV